MTTGPWDNTRRSVHQIAGQHVDVLALICASIFLSSVFKLRSIDSGFSRSQLALLFVNPAMQGYSPQRSREFILQANERLKAVPRCAGRSCCQSWEILSKQFLTSASGIHCVFGAWDSGLKHCPIASAQDLCWPNQ